MQESVSMEAMVHLLDHTNSHMAFYADLIFFTSNTSVSERGEERDEREEGKG